MRDAHEQSEAEEQRRLYAEAFERGREVGKYGVHVLIEDWPEIERALRRGAKMRALALAAEALILEPSELFAALPSPTMAGLRGYLEGLKAGAEAVDAERRSWRTRGSERMAIDDGRRTRGPSYGRG